MDTGRQRILIVDDEPHVVHVVKYKLDRAGFDVAVANDGQRGYDLACEVMPHLIVTDFQMPSVSGLELAKRLARNPDTSSIPIIMLTARGHLAPLAELAQTSVRCILAKPFSPRNLVAKVNELLGVQQATPPPSDAGRPGAQAA